MEAVSISPKPEVKSSKPIKEGKAVLAQDVSTSEVFYNPVQEFNRDLSCLVLSVFFEKLQAVCNGTSEEKMRRFAKRFPEGFQGKILDVMAATGLRTCRYALEIPHVQQVVANDFDSKACEAIRKNAQANGVDQKITVTQSDAREIMMRFAFEKNWFHAIDIDPYGSAAPFFEGALQCIADGGLLMVTCTDTAILCGNHPEACYARYGSIPVKNPAHHELSLRIVLNSLAARAMLHERFIKPLLSVREGHYIRLFLSVHRGAERAKENVRRISYIWNCNVCHDVRLQPLCDKPKHFTSGTIEFNNLCDICGATMKIGGPIWSDAIHDVDFVQDLITELERERGRFGTEKLLQGKLGMIQEELPDEPLYIVCSDLFKVVHCTPIPSKQFLSALLRQGYTFSPSHCEHDSVKTNAPRKAVWDIVRCWVKNHPIAECRLKDPRIHRIVNQAPSVEADFTFHPDADFESRRKKLLRFPPSAGKGPMAKPKGVLRNGSPELSVEQDMKKLKSDLSEDY